MKHRTWSLLLFALTGPASLSAQMIYYGNQYVGRSGSDGYSYAVVPFGWIESSTLTLRQDGIPVDFDSGRGYYNGQPVSLWVTAYTYPPAYTLFEMEGEALGVLEDYGWFLDRLYLSGVTPPPSVSVSGFNDAWDGESGYFSISVDGGTATAWQWSYSAPSGSGNNPHVTFYSPSSPSTATNAHWFASPNIPCAGNPSEYQIIGNANLQFGWYSGSTDFRIHIPATGGETHSPQIRGNVILVPPSMPGGLWTVGQNNYYRSLPSIIINLLASSQFHNKVSAHENVHYAQFTTGLFASNWNPAVAYNRVRNLTDSTQAGLDARVRAAVNAYNAEEDALVGTQMSSAETQAYAVSDALQPLFFYQNACGRH